MKLRLLLAFAVATPLSGCVAGSQIREKSEVIQNDIERARRSGALKCAPRELATAEAELDFARGELAQGNSFRARDHVEASEAAVKKAVALSKDCGPKQILIRDKEPEKKPPAVVVRIEETDVDGDGIPDKDDKCPNQPEDKDGFEDEDGCPDTDNDQDGVLDTNDKCPLEPGPLANQGCPVEKAKDADGDGIPDDKDQCPNQPEDFDGFQDDDGCPDIDNDGDGIIDSKDKCPDAPGELHRAGCPETDNDGDGIPNDIDRCISEPEDFDGFQDEDGCPDLDNDQDGIPDASDKCPDKAGPAINHGCPVTDRDGDGIPDDKDLCPLDPEDMDGFKDEDGCPDTDNDQDGIPDNRDKCPNESGELINQGCPVTDRDGDGIPDDVDKCPSQPEDKDGFEDEDGCPDPDNDKDGTPDVADKCPLVAGPAESFGCPDADTDGDGVVDRLDQCPETFGRDGKGCPKKYKRIVVERNRISLKQQILFGTGSATIVGRDSQAILAEVAEALKDNPQIKKVRVEGHTDSTGADATNLKLSQNRANAVMSALIKMGIDPARLEAVGFGEAQPIATNSTKAGRAENRRTEFNIVEQ